MGRLLVLAAIACATPLVSTAGAQPLFPQRLESESEVKAAVLAVVEGYVSALSARDWPALLARFWPEATVTTIRRPDPSSDPRVMVSLVSERVELVGPALAAKPVFEASLTAPAIFVSGNVAMVWADSETRLGEPDDPTAVAGVDAITLLRAGGEWKIAALAYQADAVTNPLPEGGSRQSILTELERYYRDFSARDWTRFAAHFWPGAMLATVWQPPGAELPRAEIQGVPDFVAAAPAGPGSKPIFEEHMGTAQVLVRNNLAQVWASYHARFGDTVEVQEWDGIDVFTLMRFGGRWRIVSLGWDAASGPGSDG